MRLVLVLHACSSPARPAQGWAALCCVTGDVPCDLSRQGGFAPCMHCPVNLQSYRMRSSTLAGPPRSEPARTSAHRSGLHIHDFDDTLVASRRQEGAIGREAERTNGSGEAAAHFVEVERGQLVQLRAPRGKWCTRGAAGGPFTARGRSARAGWICKHAALSTCPEVGRDGSASVLSLPLCRARFEALNVVHYVQHVWSPRGSHRGLPAPHARMRGRCPLYRLLHTGRAAQRPMR